MTRFSYRPIHLGCAVLAVISTTISAAGAQTPSPTRLLDDWQANLTNARTSLRSYRVDGEFQSKNLPGMMEVVSPGLRSLVAASNPPIYKWIALRDDKRFYWDATDADFEWNPNRAPQINRAALSFDGKDYYRLDLHNVRSV